MGEDIGSVRTVGGDVLYVSTYCGPASASPRRRVEIMTVGPDCVAAMTTVEARRLANLLVKAADSIGGRS